MSFSVSKIVVTSTGDKVVAIDWQYNNGKGVRGNRWELSQPYGDTPLKDCTQSVLLKWLEQQFPVGTKEALDRCIEEDNARRQEEATESEYVSHPDGPPTPVTQEIDVPDLPVTADVGATSKSKKKR